MDLKSDNNAMEDDLEVRELIELGFPREVYERQYYMDTMSDPDFLKRFRLTKGTVNKLLQLIEPRLECALFLAHSSNLFYFVICLILFL